jgi:lysyl-tRNA synthetase, class II
MLDELINERRKKLARLNEAGVDPYPARTERTHTVAAALALFEKDAAGGPSVAVAGRVAAFRDQGGVMFLDLRDGTGTIQAVLKKEDMPDFDLQKETLDRGDFISVSGPLFVTNRGQKSVAARSVKMLTKSIRPLPTEHFGVEDEELRLRKRYVELAIDPATREFFKKKTVFWATFRELLVKQGFLEVETAVLESLPGGAEAEPFKTHHNALDVDFYLRISLELPLKRLLVGGYDAVFEIGRIFRNEGIDREHLQDYTQLEFYWAYHDYNDLMKLLQKMYRKVIERTTGGLVTTYQGHEINWGAKWPKIDYVKAFKGANGIDPVKATKEQLFKKAEELGLKPETNMGKGRLIDLIFKKTVRPTLIQPAFLIDPPVEIEPLAKRKPGKPGQVERLQIVAGGTELGKGFSELNDPDDQRRRFEDQMQLREAGDNEAQFLDEDFLEALEYGMPPAAGFGVSERLFAVLMDKPVREAVFFPLMRPEAP